MIKKTLWFLLSILLASMAQAEVVVIANRSVSVSAITSEMAADIFLGKVSALPDGTKLIPVDQKDSRKSHREFYSKLIQKESAQLSAYWLRMMMSDEGVPPKKFANDEEVLALVSANPNVLGYVDAALVNDAVKVLLRIP
ncbi:MAG: phosphate ABC transporter substrate-binding protein [Pseudomonadales bacterium]|nr:phosphate ABC transporter substrate-binding protein [Pseudomonadales bacterium]